MKFFRYSVTACVALMSTSVSVDAFESAKPSPHTNSSPTWIGFYTGVNIGGAVSVADAARTNGYVAYDWAASAFAEPLDTLPPSRTGNATVSQSGVIGGGQIGYAWKFNEDVIAGLEADFQGATIQGGGSFSSVSGAFYDGHAHRQEGLVDTTAGISWLGTARARLGYLISPNILLFTTGGLAYGGTWANVNSISLHWHPGTELIHPAVPVSPSYSSTKGLNVGWTAGAGAEWGFDKNWSIKIEGLYYDLGSRSITGQYNFNVNAAAPGLVATVNAATTVAKYQGIIVRSGLNYHLNFDAPSVISSAKY